MVSCVQVCTTLTVKDAIEIASQTFIYAVIVAVEFNTARILPLESIENLVLTS